nr:T9SS type A sorting domain-containing protein [uncultured Psychroserpens sp.]
MKFIAIIVHFIYCCFNNKLLSKRPLLIAILSLSFFMTSAQTDTPCEGAQRWTQGSTWLPDGSIDDAPNAAFPNGIIRCGSSAETQSQVMPYNNSIYDSSQFEIDISGIPCIDPSTQTTVFPVNPTNGQPMIWLNFDVRAYAGSFEIQINDNSGDTIAWALYSSNAHQAGTTLAANGQQLSGDCGDLKRIACGVESSSTWNTIPIEGEDFLEPANMYLAIWDQDADGDLAVNNFKARFGCGDSDVIICSLSVEDPIVSCAVDGEYTVTVPINGANGQYTAIDPNALTISNDICLGNLGGGAISGSFTLTYSQGTDYNIDISPVDPSTNGCVVPLNPTQCTGNVSGTSPPPGTDNIEDTATICFGASYLWPQNNMSYAAEDSPVTLNLIDINGCPYTATLTISEYDVTPDDAASGEVCEGELFNYEGNDYAVGSHDIPRTDANGCPYKTVLTVTAFDVTPDDAASGEVCEGELFNYEGIDYAVGSHDIPRTDANGCPYKTVLTVTAYDVTPDDAASGEVCVGELFNYEGIDYAEGSHDIPRTDANGCPYKTVLTVTAYDVTPDDAASGEVCEGELFSYEGNDYAVGSHDIPRTDTNGCPYKTVLTVTAYDVTPDDAASGEVCEGELFNYEGNDYAVGSHDIPRTDANGCPYKTVLTVTAYDVTPDDTASGEVCEGNKFTYEGNEYDVGTYDIPRVDANGCPWKTVLTVTAYDVTPDDAASGEVCEGELFNYEGIDYAEGSHDIPRTDANGCPYKTVLTVTAYEVTPDDTASGEVCEGELFSYEGNDYAVGSHDIPKTDDNGCPYTTVLTVTAFEVTPDIVDDVTICEGDSYLWSVDGGTYSVSDSPVELDLIDSNGCPYSATLTITEDDAPDAGENGSITVCEGVIPTNEELFEALEGDPDLGGVWSGPVADVYTYTFAASGSCPEVSATVTVNYYEVTPDDVASGEVCEGNKFTYEGNEYDVGTYDIPRVDANGCPWKTVLTVTAYDVTPDDAASGEVCEGELFNYEGIDYAEGSHDIPRTDTNGCPYKTVLTVTAYEVTPDDTASGEVCEGELFSYEGNDYAVGSHDIPKTDDNGCPYTTVLTVTAFEVTPDIVDDVTICEGDSYLWSVDGGTYSVSDSPVELDLIDSNGCPYSATLTITEDDAPDAGENGSITVCEGETPTTDELFEALEGDPDLGGIWSGPVADVYTYTFAASGSCPEVSATVTVNYYEVTPDDVASGEVCEGNKFTYEGNEYDVGTYDIPRVDANGCPWKTVLTVTAYDVTPDDAASGEVCEGELFNYEGNDYAVGSHDIPRTDANGCPYKTVLTVTAYEVTPDDTASGEVCVGELFSYEGNDYAVGSHDIPKTDDNGCPYTTVLTVTAFEVTPDDTASGEVCEGNTYNYEGIEYGAGTHDVEKTDANGCPYITVLTVIVYEVENIEEEVSICEGDSYTWPVTNETYTITDSPVVIDLFDDNGCLYTATLVINENGGGDAGENGVLYVCFGETPTEEELFEALGGLPDEGGVWSGPENGQYTYTFEAIGNCPGSSAIIKVDEYKETKDIEDDVTVCRNEVYKWPFNGTLYKVSESPVVLDLIDDNGCPYTATLIINEYPVTDPIFEEVMICDDATYTWPLTGDTYTADQSPVVVKMYDGNGCSYSATLTINTGSKFDVTHESLGPICIEDGIAPLSGGQPAGGVYSGTGVIDNNDGTFSVDLTELGTGVTGLYYTFQPNTGCEMGAPFKIEVYECCEEEIAYAYAPSPGFGYESCFTESNDLYESSWGWTNGDLDLQSVNEFGDYNTYVFDLFAAGTDGDCDPTDENSSTVLVGTVTLERDGDNVLVTYAINDEVSDQNYVLGNVNAYLGCNPYPCKSSVTNDGSNNRRLCASTIDIDEYPYSGYSDDGNTITLTVPVTDITGDVNCIGDFYMIAYAEVEICLVPEDEEVVGDDKDGETTLMGRTAFSIDFKAYPVPYKDIVNIAYEFDFETNVSIEISDIRGTLIRSVRNSDYVKGSDGKTIIDLSDVKDQILFVKMITSQGSVIKKIVSSNKK